MKFRKLKANEIEVRVGGVYENCASLLLYKNARVDQTVLDETVGCMNWQRHHNRDNANCIVSIWDEEKKQWIEKEDTGKESNTEEEKGLASDSFKRACFNWGIGRELYTAPTIFVNCETQAAGHGYRLKNRNEFTGAKVTEIGYNENGDINRLVIVSKKGVKMYEFGKAIKESLNAKQMENICLLTKKAKVKEADVCGFYGIDNYVGMSVDIYEKACKKLETTIKAHEKENGDGN